MWRWKQKSGTKENRYRRKCISGSAPRPIWKNIIQLSEKSWALKLLLSQLFCLSLENVADVCLQQNAETLTCSLRFSSWESQKATKSSKRSETRKRQEDAGVVSHRLGLNCKPPKSPTRAITTKQVLNGFKERKLKAICIKNIEMSSEYFYLLFDALNLFSVQVTQQVLSW